VGRGVHGEGEAILLERALERKAEKNEKRKGKIKKSKNPRISFLGGNEMVQWIESPVFLV